MFTVFSNGVIIYRHKKSFAPGQKRPVSALFRSEIYGKNRGTFVKLMGHMQGRSEVIKGRDPGYF